MMKMSLKARRVLTTAAFVGLGMSGAHAGAQALYWDVNGTTLGAAGDGIAASSAAGTWDAATPNWNATADGTGTPAAWVDGSIATFSAGTNATMNSTVTLPVGNNEVVGGFDFQEGAVTISGPGGMPDPGSGTFTLSGSNPVFNVANGASGQIFNIISGTARWEKTGPGLLDLRGSNLNTGGVKISGGAVRIGNGNNETQLGDTPSAATVSNWLILNNGTLNTANTSSFTWPARKGIFFDTGGGTFNAVGNPPSTLFGTIFMPAQFSGSGTFTKAGPNIFVLQTANPTYSGKFVLTGGELNNTAGDTAYGTYSGPDAITLDGGTGVALRSSITATIGVTHGITLGPSGGQFDTQGQLTINSVISGPGPLIKGGPATGTNSLVLANSNTYAGNTTVSLGTLQYGANNAIPGGAGKGNVSVSTVIDLAGFNGLINGLSGTGTVTSSGAASNTLTIGGNDQSSTFSGSISNSAGTLSLAKTGTGKIVLSGNDGYTGTTTVNGGVLQATNTNAFPNFGTSGFYTVNAGGTLSVNVGSGEWDFSVVDALRTHANFIAGSALGFDTTNGSFLYSSLMDGVHGVTKFGANTLTLAAANTYSGDTTVSAGTLQYGIASALPSGSGKGNVSVAAGAALDVNGFSGTINGLSGAGVIDNAGGGTPTLTVGGNNQGGTFTGTVQNTSGTLKITKIGSGTISLIGTNTYTGGTNVQAGTLVVNRLHGLAADGTGTPNPVNITGGTLQVADSSPTLPAFPAGQNSAISRPGGMISIANNGAPLGPTRTYSGTLDLGNNDLVIDYSGATPLADVRDMIRSGYNGGNWKGTGITSSTAANPLSFGNFALGYADNSSLVNKYGDGTGDGSPAAGNAGHGPLFFGQSVDLTTVLVKFTHRVDLNLDGFITSNDASIFNGSYNEGQPATWSSGDLNYNGVFDTNDASIFNGAYNEALASLPEPSAVALLALGSGLILRRRRSA